MYQALEIMDQKLNSNYYGWFSFHPDFIQRFGSIKWALFFISIGGLIQGVAVNGFLHYFIPMIERRYELSSTKSGFMSGAYDIASLICLIPICYYGGQRYARKPLYIGTGIFIMGTGSFIFALPAFVSGTYRFADETSSNLCVEKVSKNSKNQMERNYTFHYVLLVVGNLLHGVGACPLYTLGVTYLDENSPLNKSSVYLGIYYMTAILGPSVGYLAGGFLASFYVDFPIFDEKSKGDLNPDNPSWVGCWWLGFLVCSAMAFVFSIPVLGLPKTLHKAEESTNMKTSSLKKLDQTKSEHRRKSKKDNPQQSGVNTDLVMHYPSFTGLANSIYRIVRRLKFDFITCAGFCEGVVIAGMGSFFPKILEQQMGSSSKVIAIVLGSFAVPCALVGVMFGGWMVKHYQLNLDQMILFCLFMSSLATISSTGLFLSCPSKLIAGFHIPYPTDNLLNNRSLTSECNQKCHCKGFQYDPVCSHDNINYFSPCFAGCHASSIQGGKKYYYDCNCIRNPNNSSIFEATSNVCPVSCPIFYVFVAVLCIYQVFAFSACIPALTATLRSVEEELKSLAIGIQWIAARLLGTIPGPVIFGMVFDEACSLWYRNANTEVGGVCLIYDHSMLSLYLGLIVMSFKLTGALFFTIAYCAKSDDYIMTPPGGNVKKKNRK